MEIKQISIQKIKPYANNTKHHTPEQIKHIATSIKEFGWQQPIVIDRNNEIVIGHGRYAAALSLGLDKVPCVRADDLTEQQITALRIIDNKTNESIWDLELLQGEIKGLPEFDFADFGFNEFETGTYEETEEEPEDEATVIKSEAPKKKRVIIIMRNDSEKELIKETFGIEGDIKPSYSAEELMAKEVGA